MQTISKPKEAATKLNTTSIPAPRARLHWWTLTGIAFNIFGLVLMGVLCIACLHTAYGIHGMDARTNYYYLVKDAEHAVRAWKNQYPDDLSYKKKLALALWQNMKYDEAGKLMREIWEVEFRKSGKKYSEEFVTNALNLGSVYMDQGGFIESSKVYDKLIEYDKARLKPDDARLGRDYNNLGLAQFMTAKAQANKESRMFMLKKAIASLETAEDIFEKSPDTRSQIVCNQTNQAAVLAEMGEETPAIQMNTNVNNHLQFREIVNEIFSSLNGN